MGRLTTLIVGGLVGAGIALATAPRSGAETREKVAEKVNQAWENAQGGSSCAEEPVECECVYAEPVADQAVCADQVECAATACPQAEACVDLGQDAVAQSATAEPVATQPAAEAAPAEQPQADEATDPQPAEPAEAEAAQPTAGFDPKDAQAHILDFAHAAAAKGQEFAQAAAQHAPEIAAKATEYAQHAVEGVMGTSATDADLRERIEAARARIAAQVMKNAQESSVATAEAAQPVVEAEAEATSAKAE